MTNERLKQKARCPKCDAQLDGATNLNNEIKPEVGNIAVCVYCGTVLEYVKGLLLEEISEKTLLELNTDTIMEISKVSRAVAQVNRELKERNNG